VTSEPWRCPLCKTLAESARDHLAEAHGVGGNRDRFGLRDAVKRDERDERRTSRDDTPTDFDVDDIQDPPAESPSSAFGPPIWRRVPPAPGAGRSGRLGDGGSSLDDLPLTWRKAPRPSSRRGRTGDPSEAAPSKPVPLPPDAAVLRLVCDSLDGVDAQTLSDRLRALPGVEAVTLDLYARTADLYLDRTRATAPHLVAMARERVKLPVRTAELHRSPERGQGIGAGTLIYVVQ